MRTVLSMRPRSRSIAMLFLLGAVAWGTAGAQPLPDLVITKNTLEDPPYSAGQFVHYTLAVQNLGADMPVGSTVVVRDLLSPGVALESATEGARTIQPFYLGVTCTQTQPELFCEGPAMVHDDYFIVIVRVQLPADVKGTIINHAWVDPFESVPESDESNNAAKFKIKVQ